MTESRDFRQKEERLSVFLRKSKNTSLMQALSYQIRRKAAIDDDDHLDLSTTSTVCDSRFVLGLRPLFSNLQHCHVIGQDFRNQLPQASFAGKRHEMPHQGRTNSLAVVLIDYSECDLCLFCSAASFLLRLT
jgi:hypothetical protein